MNKKSPAAILKAIGNGGLRKPLKKDRQVSTVAVIHDNKMLMAKRKKNGRWTNPGGHLNEGEDPKTGALRELFEEAGIKPDDIEYLGSDHVMSPNGGKIIHCYRVDGKYDTSTKNDPDDEVAKWKWVDISNGLPTDVAENLHSPNNILLQKLGLQKKPSGKITPKSDKLEKGLNGDWKKEGYKLKGFYSSLDDEDGFGNYHVHAFDPKGNKVGEYKFFYTTDKRSPVQDRIKQSIGDDAWVRIDTSDTHPSHQRKGLASAAYQHAESILGGKIQSAKDDSRIMSDEAKALWSQPNRPFGKSEDLGKSDDEYLKYRESVNNHYHRMYPHAKSEVDGRAVLQNIDNESSIASSMNDYDTLSGIRELPMSAFPHASADNMFYAANDHKRVKSLTEEIKNNKKISPLIVAIDHEGPYVLEGAHRIASLHALGAKSFPAKVVIDHDHKHSIAADQPVVTSEKKSDTLSKTYPKLAQMLQPIQPAEGFEDHHPEIHDGINMDHTIRDLNPNEDNFSYGTRLVSHNKIPYNVVVKPAQSADQNPGLIDAVNNSVGSEHFFDPKFTTAHREGLYHKLASKVFGLGHYVPPTTVFTHNGVAHSGQIYLPKAKSLYEHRETAAKEGPCFNDDYGPIYNKTAPLQDREKLAIMNKILGNNDRHLGNAMVDNKGMLQLIDHSSAFDYGKVSMHGIGRPSYVDIDEWGAPVSQHTQDWISKLSDSDLEHHMKRSGAPDELIKVAKARLNDFQDLAAFHKNDHDYPQLTLSDLGNSSYSHVLNENNRYEEPSQRLVHTPWRGARHNDE